jgi:energy-coupling factor transport system permease protein
VIPTTRLGAAGPAAGLDPRAKLLAVVLGLGATLAFGDWPSLAAISGVLLAFLAWGKLVREWLRVLRSVWLLAAIVFVADELYYGPGGGVLAVVKLALLVSLFSSFFLSTNPDDLALALVHMRLPYTFGFVLAASANYVPLVGREAREIMDAFEARGISRGRTPFGALRFYASILVPLVVATIRRSLRLSEALEARAFSAAPQRTFLRQLRASRRDYVFSAAAGLGTAILIAVHVV